MDDPASSQHISQCLSPDWELLFRWQPRIPHLPTGLRLFEGYVGAQVLGHHNLRCTRVCDDIYQYSLGQAEGVQSRLDLLDAWV